MLELGAIILIWSTIAWGFAHCVEFSINFCSSFKREYNHRVKAARAKQAWAKQVKEENDIKKAESQARKTAG